MKIVKSNYQGYLWYSDQMLPKVIENEVMELDLDEHVNPFIIEGLLCDGTTSWMIRYVDGAYKVKKWNLEEIEAFQDLKEAMDRKELKCTDCKQIEGFLAHRMGDRVLKFYRCWHLQNDSIREKLCEGMLAFVPGERVFLGFSVKNEGGK